MGNCSAKEFESLGKSGMPAVVWLLKYYADYDKLSKADRETFDNVFASFMTELQKSNTGQPRSP